MNEIACLAIFAIWLAGGRGYNLCFAIFMYYAAYITLDYSLFAINHFNHVGSVIYYMTQAWLDIAMIAIVLTILTDSIKIIALHWIYAAIIGTSLICDSVTAINVQLSYDWIYTLHTVRNAFSIPLDIAFAAAGSGIIAKLPSNLRLRLG